MNDIKIIWVDAFTHKLFAGNPAAVCLCESEPDATTMQALANELNLSETAFVTPLEPGHYSLRWFTPSCEVSLCGHATLASALALWHDDHHLGPKIKFSTLSGQLIAEQTNRGVALNFPAFTTATVSPPRNLISMFASPIVGAATSNFGLIIELRDNAYLTQWQADIAAIKALPHDALIITARSDSEQADVVCRVFVPKFGIDEDPVTGAAHCALADYWTQRLHKSHFTSAQLSRRGGLVEVSYDGDRVTLCGEGRIVFAGQVYLD